MRTLRPFAIPLAAATLVLTLPACGKLKSALHRGDDGGASASADGGATASGPLDLLNGFEGEIDVSASEAGKPATSFALFVKGDKLRTDFPEAMAGSVGPFGGKGHGVFNGAEKKVYIVSDPQKQVIVLDLNKGADHLKGFLPGPGGMPSPHAPSAQPSAPPKVTKTGKKSAVAGYTCEEWEIASDHREGSVCIADQGASWFHLPVPGIPTEYAWASEVFDGKHLPLRFIGYEKNGSESGRIEVTKMEKKGLDAALFEIPAGYKVVDLEQMMQGMPGLAHGPMPTPPSSPHAPSRKPNR